MLRKMQWFVAVAVVIAVVGGGLAFAQGTSGTMPDKAMSPPSAPGGMPGKAEMPMEKGNMGMPKTGMDKGGMGMEKSGMEKSGMGMEKSGMGMDKSGMEKSGMDKSGMGMDKGKAGMAASKAKTMATPVDINAADETALKSLKGIGPTKAKAIVAYRQQHGPFKSVEELEKVPGIGKKTMASLKDHLTIGKGM